MSNATRAAVATTLWLGTLLGAGLALGAAAQPSGQNASASSLRPEATTQSPAPPDAAAGASAAIDPAPPPPDLPADPAVPLPEAPALPSDPAAADPEQALPKTVYIVPWQDQLDDEGDQRLLRLQRLYGDLFEPVLPEHP